MITERDIEKVTAKTLDNKLDGFAVVMETMVDSKFEKFAVLMGASVDSKFERFAVVMETMVDSKFEKFMDRLMPVLSNFATKDDVRELGDRVGCLEESVDGLITVVDGHTKVIEDLRMEYLSMGEQLSRHDRWVYQLADKAGLALAIEA
jgi:hypothetical protein